MSYFRSQSHQQYYSPFISRQNIFIQNQKNQNLDSSQPNKVQNFDSFKTHFIPNALNTTFSSISRFSGTNKQFQRIKWKWTLLPHTSPIGNRLNPNDVNPGFFDAKGKIKLNTGTASKKLQDHLNEMIQNNQKYKNMFISLVDLSNLNSPKFAGHNYKKMVNVDSMAKVAAMLTAFQLRHDLRNLIIQHNVKSKIDLLEITRGFWLKTQNPNQNANIIHFDGNLFLKGNLLITKRRPNGFPVIPYFSRTGSYHNRAKLPDIERIFEISEDYLESDISRREKVKIDFKSTPLFDGFRLNSLSHKTQRRLWHIGFLQRMKLMIGFSDNAAAGSCIRDLGWLAIGSVLMQTGLIRSVRGGGLWLRWDYGGDSPRGVGKHFFDPYGGKGIYVTTASSMAMFFTLLARRMLVNPNASNEMLQLLDKSILPGSDTDSPLATGWGLIGRKIFSKLGVVSKMSDVVLVKHGSIIHPSVPTYVAVVLSGRNSWVFFEELGKKLENCIRTLHNLPSL